VLSSFFGSEEVLWFFLSFFTFRLLVFLLYLWSFLIEFHELGKIKLGFLENLDFLDHNVLEWENLTAFFLNLFTNGLLNKLLAQFFKSRLLSLSNQDLHHSLTDSLFLGTLGVTSGLHLFASSFSEPNGKQSQHVSIGSLGLNECFDQSVPFLNKLAELVFGDVHSVEIGIAIVSLDFFNLYLHFSPVFIVAFVL